MRSISIAVSTLFFLATVSAANNNSLFNVVATGTPGDISFVLCLNAIGHLSCEAHTVSALTLSITTTALNHTYSDAGIKVNTPDVTLVGCTINSKGYCLFTVSDTSSADIGVMGNAYPLVTVGNPGNAADITGFGAVNYSYQIGKYDVTIGEYTNFLNAVAKADPYGLYNAGLGVDLNSAGITRSGTSGNYTYTVMNNGGSSANRPITYVTWFDAARFANWMANGKPVGGENNTTTEDGAYALHGAVSGNAVVKNTVNPNTGFAPIYAIPTENEWYKAAYYDPTLNGGAGGYYLYATKSNTAPGNVIGSAFNQVNYFPTFFSVTQSSNYFSMTQNYLTDVGAFSGSGSYYGTFDQDGDVWQWNDLDGAVVPYRGLRGGYWFSGSVPMQSVLYSTDTVTRADSGIGFRLVSPAS